MLANFHVLTIKNGHCPFITACSLPKGHSGGTLQLVIDELSSRVRHSQLTIQSSSEHVESEKISVNTNEGNQGKCEEADHASSSAENTPDDKEMQRRRRIGEANKGRIPWNKGRTHSEETREHISKRTIEALSDPKIRKKMSEYPRSHSNESKARISSALKKIWEERLRRKKLQENCYLTWTRSIAEAAKKGSQGQEELEWDSYERMKSNINLQHLQQKAEKARAKEIVNLKVERAAKVRAENAARRAQLRKEKEEREKDRAKFREMKASARKKSEKMKMKMVLSKGLKLKARISKFHQHKRNSGSYASMQREIAVEPQPTIDNLEIDLSKIETRGRKISLADQIQAVKNRKGEFGSDTLLASTFPISSSEVEAGGS